MPLLQLSQLSLAYGHVPLLDHVDLVVEPGERIGLIGRNGTGKSTLLKIIEGLAAADDGKVWRAPQLKLASVSQEPSFQSGQSVFEAVAEGLGKGTKLLVDYHAATHALAAHGLHAPEDDVALMERVQHLQEALDASDGWSLQHRIAATLSRLQLSEDDPVSELSGGLKKRVALARALVMAPDLLLLDEPTNHLDFTAIEWLEETLLGFAGSVLLVTHDRPFLDSVALRIVDPHRGPFSAYPARPPGRADRAERQGQDDTAPPDPRGNPAGFRQGAPRHEARHRLFRPVPRGSRRRSYPRRNHQPGKRPRRSERREKARDRISRGFSLPARARPGAGEIALRRRAQPPAARAPLLPSRQPAGVVRADQRSGHRHA